MTAKRKAKTTTKKDLESKIAALEAKLSKLSTQLEKPVAAAETKPTGAKPAETKPAGAKPAETKPAGAKPAETKPADTIQPKMETRPKPAETTQPPATVQEALENAYRTAPMSDFHQYRAKVTGYSPASNRYFVRLTAPVGTVPTSNWNDQKTKVTGYTQPSNQYFATRARLAYHPPDKTFGSFSGVSMSIDGVTAQVQQKPSSQEAPRPADGKLPKETTQTHRNEGKSRQQLLEEYETDYIQRREQQKIENEKALQELLEDESKARSNIRGTLPKGFKPTAESKPEAPKTSKGTLPKGF